MEKTRHLLLTLLLAFLCVGGAWAGEETVTLNTLTPTATSAAITFEKNNGSTYPFLYTKGEVKHVRLYGKGTLTIAPKAGYTLTKIDYAFVINANKKGNKPTPTLSSTEGTFETTSTGGTWTGSTTNAIALLADGSAGNLEFSSVKITYTSASSKQASTVAFATPSYSFKQGSDEVQAFNGQTATTTPDGLTLTYASDNESVASVEASTGAVTLTGTTGKATITASFAGDDTYDASSASYTIDVTPNITNDGTADKPYTVADVFTLNDAGMLPTEEVYVKGTISKVESFDSKYGELTYYISDDGTTTKQLQIYNGSGQDGAKFTGTADLSAGWDVTVKGTLKEFNGTLEMNYGSQITSLVKDAVVTPVISGSTAFLDNTEVTLTTSDEGAKMYYTTNGDEPTDQSTLYTAPFTLNATATVKAIAYLNGNKSQVSSQNFKKVEDSDLTTVADALKADDGTTVYVKGVVVKTSKLNSNYTNLNYYIADSDDAADNIQVYRGTYLKGADITDAFQIVCGDEVVLAATVDTYNNAKELKDAQLLSLKEYQDKATVTAAGWATFVSRRAVDFSKSSDISAYTVKYDATANQVTLSPVTAIPGNTAVVVKANVGTYELQRGDNSATVADNDLTFSWSDKKVTADYNIYVLAQQGDGCGFYAVKNGDSVAPFKGYLTITASTAAKPFYALGNTTTGISNVVKATGNEEDVRYNLAGQRVSNNYKGLVIANGHKVIIK